MSSAALKARSSSTKRDLVATWNITLSDGTHKVDFEHGSTSGRRVIYVDDKEVKRVNWMFKLVGKEEFYISNKKHKGCITIQASPGFAYEYTLKVDGKELEKFQRNKDKSTKSWTFLLDETDYRLVLEKDTMDVWCNGAQLPTAGEFCDSGTETHFAINDHRCYIRALSSGNKREGIIHTLHVDNKMIPDPLNPMLPQ